jgi:RES domain-containing protein
MQSAGRWNHAGFRVVYLAEHVALTMLEVLVNAGRERPLERYALIPIVVPAAAVTLFEDGRLPPGWDGPLPNGATRDLGTAWLTEARSLVLSVPSAVVPHERNFLLNPAHPDFAALEVGEPETFVFDPRLF